MTDLPYPPPFQDLATLSEHLSTGETTIENWVKLGQFPKPKKVGGKRLWSWKEVCRFIEGPQDPTTVNLLERITNATREAAGPKNSARNIRKRDQGIPRVAEVRRLGASDTDELPVPTETR